MYFDGALDDLAFFAGVLTDAEIQERWDQSLTVRAQAGLAAAHQVPRGVG